MLKKGNILIVDDNESILEALGMLLKFKFEKVTCIANPNRLVTLMKTEKFDVIILDMNFSAGVNSGNEGLYWLKEILNTDPMVSVITITAYGDVSLAVKSLKLGASDFLLKPWDNKKLLTTIDNSLKLRKSRNKTVQQVEIDTLIPRSLNNQKHMIGKSPAYEQVMEAVKKVAETDANVLITGENGTGKELVAREIHRLSKRSRKKMVGVDLGALSTNLFESELFGHTKGSFTDAVSDRLGKFEEADTGTLFLDEIGNLALESQAKLLAAIQNRNVTRVGSNTEISVDIRLVCATNSDLEQQVKEGDFRQDLLFRINTIEIEIPALRDRPEDIPMLTDHFLSIYKEKYLKNNLTVNDQIREELANYSWPGNIRELEHMIEKAVILSDNDQLNENDFNFKSNIQHPTRTHVQTLEEMERMMIIEVVNKYEGNISSAAVELGIARQTLYNKIRKFDLEDELIIDDK